MNCLDCLDCLDDDQLAAPAVAGCVLYGCAVCHRHVVISATRLTRAATMSQQQPVDPPARTARCHACQTAYDATRQPAAPAARRGCASSLRRSCRRRTPASSGASAP